MNPQSCEEAMRLAERISDIEANTGLTYGNQLATFNNRSWTTTTDLMGRGLTRGEASQNQWMSNTGQGVPLLNNTPITSACGPVKRR